MPPPRVTETDRAYFRRLGEANESLVECDPAGTLDEVFRRLLAIERRYGDLASPALEADPKQAECDAAALALRFRRGRGARA